MKKIAITITTAFLLSIRLIAQDTQEAPKVKFEKVPEEELSMKSYAQDTTAEAVILYDNGSSYVKYEVDRGFRLTYERFVRIKILKQSGVDWGNFRLSLYSSNNNHEDLNGVKGTTINLENGKAVKSELKKSAIFKEQENKNWESVKLSMPSVKVGSVIDLQYAIITPFIWNLRTWKFQYSIPVKWSQYKVVYPEYYIYNHSSLGYHRLLYNKKSSASERIQYTVREAGSFGRQEMSNQAINYLTQTFDYACKDVPALKEESYLTSIDNYTTQMKFELASEDFSSVGGKVKNFTSSWNDVAKQLNDEDNFGLQLKGNNFAQDVVKALTKGTTDELKKIGLIFSHVQQTMKWDGLNRVYTSKNLKKAYSDKTGNSSDINLLLTAMLREGGINANPVILSTRKNGMISPAHASISDCNYVIVSAVVDGKTILLDATEPNLQAGYIPFRCLNGEGHVIMKDSSQPVLLSDPKSTENTTVQLELKNGKMTGIIQKRASGLSAYDFRESVKSSGNKKEYFDKLKNGSTNLDYLEYKYDNLDSLNLPVQINYKFAMKEGPDGDAGIIYVDPVLIGRLKVNPFTSPEREYPVDYGVAFTDMYSFQLSIPEGYTVAELPETKTYALPGQGGLFLYQTTQVGDKIVLNLRLTIDKSLFVPSEYPVLKTFYDLVINKEAQQIILKKKTT